MQTESFYVAVGLLLLAVVLYRVQLLYRAGGDRSVLWYCVGVTLGVPYILLRLPSVHSAIGQAVGTHNIAHPLAMCIVVVGCHLIRPLHRGLHVPTDPATPTRRTAVLLLAAVATIAPAFALVRVAEDSTWFVEHNPAAPFVLEYQFSYSFWLLLGFSW